MGHWGIRLGQHILKEVFRRSGWALIAVLVDAHIVSKTVEAVPQGGQRQYPEAYTVLACN
jgi:hypothetical protein